MKDIGFVRVMFDIPSEVPSFIYLLLHRDSCVLCDATQLGLIVTLYIENNPFVYVPGAFVSALRSLNALIKHVIIIIILLSRKKA